MQDVIDRAGEPLKLTVDAGMGEQDALTDLSDVAVKQGNAMTFEDYKEAASRRSAALCSSFIKRLSQ